MLGSGLHCCLPPSSHCLMVASLSGWDKGSQQLTKNNQIDANRVCCRHNIYIYATPPPRYPGLGLVQMCFDRGSRQEEQLRFANWETKGRRFASLKKHALDVTHAHFQWLFHTNSIHISSHTNHALFQRLFHRNLHILSPNTCLFTCLLSMKQRQHM